MALLLGFLLIKELSHAVTLPVDSPVTLTADSRSDAISVLHTLLLAERDARLGLKILESSEIREKRSIYDGHHGQHYVEITPLRSRRKNKDGKTPLAIILAPSDLIEKRNNRNLQNVQNTIGLKGKPKNDSKERLDAKKFLEYNDQYKDKVQFSFNKYKGVGDGDAKKDVRKDIKLPNVDESDSESFTVEDVSDVISGLNTAKLTKYLLMNSPQIVENRKNVIYSEPSDSESSESQVDATNEPTLSFEDKLYIYDINHGDNKIREYQENSFDSTNSTGQQSKNESLEGRSHELDIDDLSHYFQQIHELENEDGKSIQTVNESLTISLESKESTYEEIERLYGEMTRDNTNFEVIPSNENDVSEDSQYISLELTNPSVEMGGESTPAIEKSKHIKVNSSKELDKNSSPLIIESSSLENSENSFVSHQLIDLNSVENNPKKLVSFSKYNGPEELSSAIDREEDEDDSLISENDNVSETVSLEDLREDKNIKHEPENKKETHTDALASIIVVDEEKREPQIINSENSNKQASKKIFENENDYDKAKSIVESPNINETDKSYANQSSVDLNYIHSEELKKQYHDSMNYLEPANNLYNYWPLKSIHRHVSTKLNKNEERHSNHRFHSKELDSNEESEEMSIDQYKNKKVATPQNIIGVLDTIYDDSEFERVQDHKYWGKNRILESTNTKDGEDKRILANTNTKDGENDKRYQTKTYNLSFVFNK